MDLIDRFGRVPLAMAAFQLFVLLVTLGYGLWPPSLGTHMVLPGLVIIAAFGAMIWLTLTRPWEPTPVEDDPPTGGTARYLWDRGLMVAVTLGVSHLYRGIIDSGKDTLRRFEGAGEIRTVHDWLAQVRAAEEMEVWAADPYGAELLSEGGVILALFLPAAFLLILWLFLPS